MTKSGQSTERGKIGLKDRGLYILVMLFPLPLWKKITQKLGNFSEDFIWVICGGFYLGNFVEDFIWVICGGFYLGNFVEDFI